MTSPTAAIEPMLATSARVLREITTAEDLIAAYPSLKQKSLLSPPTMTDFERRLFLDLPDEDMETANISAVTTLTRQQLLDKAVSDPEQLTQEEAVLLKDRFWAPFTSSQKHPSMLTALANAGPEGIREYLTNREVAYAPNEQAAFSAGSKEVSKRWQFEQSEKLRAAANLVLPDAKEWIQHLYRQEVTNWGFVCLYDAAAQQIDPARLEYFSACIDSVFDHALEYNGSKDIIHRKWRRLCFNAPHTGFAPSNQDSDNADVSSSETYHDGAIFRKAFQEILKNPEEYQKAEDVTPRNTPTHQYVNGIPGSGLLTNTFLVIDPACIDSVLGSVSTTYTHIPSSKLYDDMRILAFEADFPLQGREYPEGYQGFTWVRLDQLVYNFYELRLMKADEVGMDEIWKAAQQSRNHAFVSMDDPEKASKQTSSNGMRGFTRDSVLGKRFYALRDARQG